MANNSADIVKAEQKPAERQKQIGRNKGKKSHIKALTWGFFYDIPLDSLAIYTCNALKKNRAIGDVWPSGQIEKD